MLHQQQQQFEIQQRQIEQMYRGSATSSQSLTNQQSSLQSGSPMIISNPPSFDSFHPSNVGAAMPLLQKARSQSPSTPGKMNPQAATFDPSSKSDNASSS
jgi:hypothetical protein